MNSGVNQNTIGGAVFVACDFMNSAWKFFTSSSNSNPNAWSNDKQGEVSYLSSTDKFKIYLDKSLISGNTFTENMAGQSGTALYIRQLSFVSVIGNTFLKNQPVYSFVPGASLSPFYLLLANKKRHSMFYSKTRVNELQFYDLEPTAAKRLFLPQV